MPLQVPGTREVGVEGGFRADRLRGAARIDPTCILAARTPDQRGAFLAQTAERIPLFECLKLTDMGDALRRKALGESGADSRQHAYRLGREQLPCIGATDHREAARLVPVS